MDCAGRERDGMEYAGARRAIHSSAKLTKTRAASVSIAFHLQAPASPIKTPEQQKRNLRRPTLRSSAIAALYATKLHIGKTIKNASIMPTGDITKRKLLKTARQQRKQGENRAKAEEPKDRRRPKSARRTTQRQLASREGYPRRLSCPWS